MKILMVIVFMFIIAYGAKLYLDYKQKKDEEKRQEKKEKEEKRTETVKNVIGAVFGLIGKKIGNKNNTNQE